MSTVAIGYQRMSKEATSMDSKAHVAQAFDRRSVSEYLVHHIVVIRAVKEEQCKLISFCYDVDDKLIHVFLNSRLNSRHFSLNALVHP